MFKHNDLFVFGHMAPALLNALSVNCFDRITKKSCSYLAWLLGWFMTGFMRFYGGYIFSWMNSWTNLLLFTSIYQRKANLKGNCSYCNFQHLYRVKRHVSSARSLVFWITWPTNPLGVLNEQSTSHWSWIRLEITMMICANIHGFSLQRLNIDEMRRKRSERATGHGWSWFCTPKMEKRYNYNFPIHIVPRQADKISRPPLGPSPSLQELDTWCTVEK